MSTSPLFTFLFTRVAEVHLRINVLQRLPVKSLMMLIGVCKGVCYEDLTLKSTVVGIPSKYEYYAPALLNIVRYTYKISNNLRDNCICLASALSPFLEAEDLLSVTAKALYHNHISFARPVWEARIKDVFDNKEACFFNQVLIGGECPPYDNDCLKYFIKYVLPPTLLDDEDFLVSLVRHEDINQVAWIIAYGRSLGHQLMCVQLIQYVCEVGFAERFDQLLDLVTNEELLTAGLGTVWGFVGDFDIDSPYNYRNEYVYAEDIVGIYDKLLTRIPLPGLEQRVEIVIQCMSRRFTDERNDFYVSRLTWVQKNFLPPYQDEVVCAEIDTCFFTIDKYYWKFLKYTYNYVPTAHNLVGKFSSKHSPVYVGETLAYVFHVWPQLQHDQRLRLQLEEHDLVATASFDEWSKKLAQNDGDYLYFG